MHNPMEVPPLSWRFLGEHLHQPIEVYLLTGVRLVGTLLTFDQSGLLLGRRHTPQLVMWHAVSTVSELSEKAREHFEREE